MNPSRYHPYLCFGILNGLLLSSFCQANPLFEQKVRPLLKKHCNTCHSTEKQKGELDLERFGSMDAVRKEPMVWQHLLEQVKTGEMPPKKEPQLVPEEKSVLISWAEATLNEIALANAGDPGPVVMRRLSNMEYTYTIRDLTGVETLDPAREFPVDGAAGEGFTNAGAALVMSPTLLGKYLDAAKGVAEHVVLLPDGIRFAPTTSAQDRTDDVMQRIRQFYGRHTTSGVGEKVTQQGIAMDVGTESGRLPLGKYLDALQGRGEAAGLSQKYLQILKAALTGSEPSLLLAPLREKFKTGVLKAADLEPWQKALWRFTSIGHIGKVGGPTAWQERVDPLAAKVDVRFKLPAPADGRDVTIYLATTDAGDGAENDVAVWENPRLVAAGRPDLPLKHLGVILEELQRRKEVIISSVAKCLMAADEAESATAQISIAELAQKHAVDPAMLTAWVDYLGIGSVAAATLAPLHDKKIESTPDYNFIKGWTAGNDLSVLANSSDASVRIPGVIKPRSIATHPSPTVASVIAWRSPVGGQVRVTGTVQHAHPECGNGIAWALEMRRGNTRDVLANGVSEGAKLLDIGSHQNLRVRPGDALALIIGPRDGNHSCDLTAVDLVVQDGEREWSLTKDVSPDILAGNPHTDSHGNAAVWHFFGEPAKAEAASKIPAGSLLAKWRNSRSKEERAALATKVQELLERGSANDADKSVNEANIALHRDLLSFNGPLLASAVGSVKTLGDANLPVTGPGVIEFSIPASLAAGTEFVATGKLTNPEGSVQMQATTTKPEQLAALLPGKTETIQKPGQWSDNNLRTLHSAPILVTDGSAARKRFEADFESFRSLFPAALCYLRIVPVDEVVTLRLYYREDDHLCRLLLENSEIQLLDRLWAELKFVSEAPLKQVDAYEQLWQYATQDADPKAFEPLREPFRKEAEAFRQEVTNAEPSQLQAVLDWAALAWRKPNTSPHVDALRPLYDLLRKQELAHPAAIRMLVARVLVSPAFLYRGEKAAPGAKAAPVADWELATRLSYFLWSSAPDKELRELAASGKLRGDILPQVRRMLKDPRVRRLATEFGCQWLHVRDVATLDEKSERHFAAFLSLREPMQEEAVRFLTDFFQHDRSVLSLLDADHTFVNAPLAKHYGMTNVTTANTDGWGRVEGMRDHGRGGILGFAATLAKHSGASRTSPILRGTWLSEVILGERLPIPPKGVPVLPEEAPQGLTERQLTERHSSDERCAGCHRRIDPFGFALEGFDAIGMGRTKDAAGLPIETHALLPDGTSVTGLDGLRNYLLNTRRDDFLRQFCRKLIGYALGRSVQISDRPLIDLMLAELKSGEFRSSLLIERIVQSPQFQNVRGEEADGQ